MIRSDRRQPSMYEDLLAQYRSGEMLPYLCAESRLTTNCQPADNQMTTTWQPSDNQTSTNCQPSIGKYSIGKVSIDKESTKPPRHTYGQYKNVYLSDEELSTLQAEFPHDWQQRIERVSDYAAGSGKTYKNYLAVIRAWARKDNARAAPAQPAKPTYDLEGVFT